MCVYERERVSDWPAWHSYPLVLTHTHRHTFVCYCLPIYICPLSPFKVRLRPSNRVQHKHTCTHSRTHTHTYSPLRLRFHLVSYVLRAWLYTLCVRSVTIYVFYFCLLFLWLICLTCFFFLYLISLHVSVIFSPLASPLWTIVHASQAILLTGTGS